MMKKSFNFKLYFFCLSIIIFTISIFRAIRMGITIDETFTYLLFVRGKWLANTGVIANNHLLNTVFIMILTSIFKLSFNEFFIRIPNLVFYLVYLYYVYRLSNLYLKKITISTVLLLNYSVNEFASLARGYGIASAFIVGGLYYYKLYLKNSEIKYSQFSFFLFLMGGFANTTNLIIFIGFLLDFTIRIAKKEKLKELMMNHKKYIFLIMLCFLSLLVYHFYICFHDQSLATCHKDLFSCMIYSPMNYYGISFLFNKLAVITFMIFGFLFLIVNYKRIKVKSDNLCYMILIIYFLFVICKVIFPFHFPSGRTLIPFMSIYIISIIDFIGLFSPYYHLKFLSILIIGLCFFSFFKNVDINFVREWKVKENLKSLVHKKYKNKEKISLDEISSKSYYNLLFYYEKYKLLYSYQLISDEDYYKIVYNT